MFKKLSTTFAVGFIASLLYSGAASAAEYEVKMLNKGSDGTAMVFEPRVLHIQPGDTVKFVPTDRGHNVESFKGGIPEGAEAFKSSIGQEFSVTFDQEGVYAYKCSPHVSMGMLGAVVVGEATNLEAVEALKIPGKGKDAFKGVIEEIKALPAGEATEATEVEASPEVSAETEATEVVEPSTEHSADTESHEGHDTEQK